MNLVNLKSELLAGHPGTGAYAADNEAAANQLNATNRPGERGLVNASDVFEAIVPAEWAALSANEKQRVQTILGMGQVNLKGPNTRASLAAAFGPATTTRANLVALQAGPSQSRAFELFGELVTPSHVADARRL